MRELIGLFSDKGTLDELGIGQVRDAFADLLFPGTSTLHTRARYLVIVPWCYLAAEQKGRSGAALTRQVEEYERTLIATLKKAGVKEGLIGRVAGVAVKNLPSTIYWTALAQYGIRHGEENGAWLSRETAGDAEADELADRVQGMWHPTVPERPAGFPYELPGGLDLSEMEARWLRDRMMAGATGSLLAHLLGQGQRPVEDSAGPWDDPVVDDAPQGTAQLLRHAELFSLAMHGASLLYNLLVAERYETEGFTQVDEPVDDYRELLAEWAAEVEVRAGVLAAWDRDEMWRRVIEQNPRVATNVLMRQFADVWLDAVATGSALSAADDSRLRDIVGRREQVVKRAQSRLVNERMLRRWSGASGSSRLTFRWPNVRRLVTDVHEGLGGRASDAAA